jgi:hypothetical protein
VDPAAERDDPPETEPLLEGEPGTAEDAAGEPPAGVTAGALGLAVASADGCAAAGCSGVGAPVPGA